MAESVTFKKRFQAAFRQLDDKKPAQVAPEIAVVESILGQALSVNSLPIPDDVLAYEAGYKGYDLYRDMLYKDQKLGEVARTRINEILATKWEITPFIEAGSKVANSESEKQADFIKYCFLDFEAADITKLIETAYRDSLQMGYSITEPIWGYDEKWGKYRPLRFAQRAVSRFRFGTEWQLQLITMGNLMTPTELDPNKFIVIRHGGGVNNPYGDPLGKESYWLYWAKLNIIKFWGIYMERFGTPALDVTYDSQLNNDPATKIAIDTILDKYGHAAGIKHPDNIKLTLLEAKRAGKGEYDTFLNYVNSQFTKTWLGQTLTTGEGDRTGSMALGNVHTKTSDDVLRRDWSSITSFVNQQIIRVIIDINFGNVAGYPSIKADVDPPEDLVTLVDVYDKAQSMGLAIGEEHFRDRFGIPPPEDGETLLEKVMPQPLGGAPGNDDNKDDEDEDDNEPAKGGDDEKKFADISHVQGTRFFMLETRGEPLPTNVQMRKRFDGKKKRGVMFLCDDDGISGVRFDSKFITLEKAVQYMSLHFQDYTGKQPPPGVKLLQIGSTFHLFDPFRLRIEALFATMQPDLINLLEQNQALRATVGMIVQKRMTLQLNAMVPGINETAITFGMDAIASQLSLTMNASRYSELIDRYLEQHAFRSKTISDVTKSMTADVAQRLTARSRNWVRMYGAGDLSLDQALSKIKVEFAELSAYKARQIAVSEVNNAANWATNQIIQSTGGKFDAYFLVDPASCEVCKEQAARNPYTPQQAEILALPHPNCNDFWSYVLREVA